MVGVASRTERGQFLRNVFYRSHRKSKGTILHLFIFAMMQHRSLETARAIRSFHRNVYVSSHVWRILHILSVHWFGHCIASIDLNRIDNKHEVLLAMTTSVQKHVQTLPKTDFYFINAKSFSLDFEQSDADKRDLELAYNQTRKSQNLPTASGKHQFLSPIAT